MRVGNKKYLLIISLMIIAIMVSGCTVNINTGDSGKDIVEAESDEDTAANEVNNEDTTTEKSVNSTPTTETETPTVSSSWTGYETSVINFYSDGEEYTLLGENNEILYITNYANATNPSYFILKNFLYNDKTCKIPDEENVFGDTMRTGIIHDNMEKEGIRCAYGLLTFEDGWEMPIIVFEATDGENYYIYCPYDTSNDKVIIENVKSGRIPTFESMFYSNVQYDYGENRIGDRTKLTDVQVFW